MSNYTFALHFNGLFICNLRIEAESEFAAYMQGLAILSARYPVKHLQCSLTPVTEQQEYSARKEPVGALVRMISYEAGQKIEYDYKHLKAKTV